MSAIKDGISQFVRERSDLEARLLAMIDAEVKAFVELTGVNVDGISINMVRIQPCGQPDSTFVTSVDVDTSRL